VLAYSRILADQEVLVVANTTASSLALDVIVDRALSTQGMAFAVRWSNRSDPISPAPLRSLDRVDVVEANGGRGSGPVLVCPVVLHPREAQILSRA
jgi:hypothetical protein